MTSPVRTLVARRVPAGAGSWPVDIFEAVVV